MTWKNFKEEKEAREIYEKYKGEIARILLKNAEVVEKDGDEKLTDEMKKYAENNYKKS